MPQYLKRMTDRHGKRRLYFSRAGFQRRPLPLEDDPAFEAAYLAALSSPAQVPPLPPARRQAKPSRRRVDPPRARRTWSEEQDFFKRLATLMRVRSGKRRYEFDLDAYFLFSLFDEQDGRCAVSGIEMERPQAAAFRTDQPFMISVDRIDNSKGYTRGNVRLVCLIVNLAMNTWGPGPLERLALAMANGPPA